MDNTLRERYFVWMQNVMDDEYKKELSSIANDEKEIEDRFYKELSFGTGGLRGILGVGTNRMNIYTVGKATFGLADYLLEIGGDSIVIAYDSRNKSAEFARLAAEIMSFKGIKAYLFAELTPTPVLSFAVRHLHASAGIVITASHNPKEYNGYKVYNSLGCQITDEAAQIITEKINNCDYFNRFVANENLVCLLDERVKRAFLDAIKEFLLTKITENNSPSVVYSPLYGTGMKYVEQILREIGVKKLHIVKEQENPDGNFSTCPYPNPEEKTALTLALRDAEIYKPDLVMATDPDADRIGIAVPNENGEYVLLNGNETGCILMYYVLLKKSEMGIIGINPTVIKTIVTTDIAFEIAKDFNAEVKEVLTGFKYIGESLETTENYVLGMEESYGYLVGRHVRDKDAISAAMMLTEACAYFKEKNKSLYAVLCEIYEKYGYYKTELKSISMPGKDGMERMCKQLLKIRENPLKELDGENLVFDDFSKGLYGLPQSDVLRFKSENYRIIIRPSGTEPKMKIYLQVKSEKKETLHEKMAKAENAIESLIS